MVSSCSKWCSGTKYTGSITIADFPDLEYENVEHGSLSLILESKSNIITVHEEYLVYDVIGVIGSIGGSLGLFIGFSFYDLICKVLDIVQWKQNKTTIIIDWKSFLFFFF